MARPRRFRPRLRVAEQDVGNLADRVPENIQNTPVRHSLAPCGRHPRLARMRQAQCLALHPLASKHAGQKLWPAFAGSSNPQLG